MNGILASCANYSYIRSSELTILSHTISLGNLAGIMIILVSIAIGQFKVNAVTTYGILCISFGIFLLFISKEEKGNDVKASIVGDLYGILSSVFFSGMLLSASDALNTIAPFTLFFF